MPPENPDDYSEEAEMGRFKEIAEGALGLEFGEIRRSGSEANMVGIQSEHVLLSQRLDSRTYFVQDMRYGANREAGIFEGADEELLARCRTALERLNIPQAEIGEAYVLTEQTQAAEVNQGRMVRMEEVREGKRLGTLSRQIDGVPVWSSSLVLGLARGGEIGFLQLHWPEISERVASEAHKLDYLVGQGWRPAELRGATVEAVEAGIIHSPALGFIMDIYPAIRVTYAPLDKAYGRKPTLYLDRHGNQVPTPRQFALPPEEALLRRSIQGTAEREDEREAGSRSAKERQMHALVFGLKQTINTVGTGGEWQQVHIDRAMNQIWEALAWIEESLDEPK